MSQISLIHDALTTLVGTFLPGYRKLANPYDVEDNNELYLTKGYGIAVQAGSRTNRELSCRASWQRDFSIVLTRKVTTTDHNIDSREDIVKAMLEDHFKIFKALELNGTLNQTCQKAEVFSDAGIQYLSGGTGRYFLLEIDVIIEYFEDLTS